MDILDMPSAAAFLRVYFKHTLLRRNAYLDRNLCSNFRPNIWRSMPKLSEWLRRKCEF